MDSDEFGMWVSIKGLLSHLKFRQDGKEGWLNREPPICEITIFCFFCHLDVTNKPIQVKFSIWDENKIGGYVDALKSAVNWGSD